MIKLFHHWLIYVPIQSFLLNHQNQWYFLFPFLFLIHILLNLLFWTHLKLLLLCLHHLYRKILMLVVHLAHYMNLTYYLFHQLLLFVIVLAHNMLQVMQLMVFPIFLAHFLIFQSTLVMLNMLFCNLHQVLHILQQILRLHIQLHGMDSNLQYMGYIHKS